MVKHIHTNHKNKNKKMNKSHSNGIFDFIFPFINHHQAILEKSQTSILANKRE